MLEHCHAFVVGKDEEQDHNLLEAATNLGFKGASPMFRKGVANVDMAHRRLSFFLVHHHLDESTLQSLITTVRWNGSDQVKFAPLIMLLHDGPFELVLRFVRMGFDDVITLPERREMVASRLRTQLDHELVYFKTTNYLGPDRRRMELPTDLPDERRTGTYAHSRYTIIRSPQTGVRVLKREAYGPRGYIPEIDPVVFPPAATKMAALRH